MSESCGSGSGGTGGLAEGVVIDVRRLMARGAGAIPRGGALLLPRTNHPAHGATNWPRCVRCLRAVDAYGIANETDAYIEVWGRCGGVSIDPRTGKTQAFAPRIHPSMQDSIKLFKGPGWSANRFTDLVRRMGFFAPDGDRQFKQTLDGDGGRIR